jgi:hypothetical protein
MWPLYVDYLVSLSDNLAELFLWEVATPPVVPAWSIPKTSSASNICRLTALRSLVAVNDTLRIVPFMAS